MISLVDLLVRPALPADCAAMAHLHVESWQAAYRGLLPDSFLDGLSVAHREQRCRQWLDASSGRQVVVCEWAGELAGFVVFTAGRVQPHAVTSGGEIFSLYVSPTYWGQGCGRTLLEVAMRCLRESGHGSAQLWVLEGNLRAVKLYKAAGFEISGATKVTEKPGGACLHQLQMQRSL